MPPPRGLSVSVADCHAGTKSSRFACQLKTPPTGSSMDMSHYQPSDFGDFDDDPFFGADFANLHPGSPTFLQDPAVSAEQAFFACKAASRPTQPAGAVDGTSYPLSPARTASLSAHNISPTSERGYTSTYPAALYNLPDSVSPEQLQMPFNPVHAVAPSDLTPTSTTSPRSGDDGLAPVPVAVSPQSPRVTVSVWDKDDSPQQDATAPSFEPCPLPERGDVLMAGDLISPAHGLCSVLGAGDRRARQQDGSAAQRVGLDPESRPPEEVPSLRELMAQKRAQDRNQEVGDWVAKHLGDPSAPQETPAQVIQTIEQPGLDREDGIPLGDQTENRHIPGQTYYNEAGAGQLTQVDRDIIAADHKWEDAPLLPQILTNASGPSQPQTSQAAIEKFERMCRDNDSILSRSATWGTRRRSHPSIFEVEFEGTRTGGFLKKLSLGRGNGEKSAGAGGKAGSLLRDLRGLVRRPSTTSLRKRSRSRSRGPGDDEGPAQPGPEQHSTTARLSPTPPAPTWRKKPTPSINTALASVANSIVNIGTPQPRCGSICVTPPMPSPRSGLTRSLSVRSTLRRPRSKSDIPKAQLTPATAESHPSLVEMWKRSGGPPVTPLGKVSHGIAAAAAADDDDNDDDDDDDDDSCEDGGIKVDPNLIDSVAPTLDGFWHHMVTLNPGLGERHDYLVERIAHQQVVRYKNLLNAKVKHLGLGAGCPCGSLCATLGGSAVVIDAKGDAPAAAAARAGDDGGAAAEGVIGPDSFPQDIPMPPTQRLPAEFECQLCFQRKRFHKPSDWTKHVHEDVQPFTCTWDKCRDPKMFKRKADWVRHENEGHRHLEWWTCDVDDCRHTCYRRDNFLQHLVREHKFPEPKVKTKAAMKRAGGMDPTWQEVEKCHVATSARPQDEPCRFCGKSLPTWKKLTVHLAKHMEHISLPVLRLVAARSRELGADTVISPVQDLAPWPGMALSIQTGPPAALYGAMPLQPQPQQPQQNQHQQHQQPPPPPPPPPPSSFPPHGLRHVAVGCADQSPFAYPATAADASLPQTPLYASPHLHGNGRGLRQGPSCPTSQGYPAGGAPMHGLHGTSDGFVRVPRTYNRAGDGGAEPFPQLDALALQGAGEPPTPLGGGQPGYETAMDPCGGMGAGQFGGHEPAPAYMMAPMWDEASQLAALSDNGRLTSLPFF